MILKTYYYYHYYYYCTNLPSSNVLGFFSVINLTWQMRAIAASLGTVDSKYWHATALVSLQYFTALI